jgi:heptosyltransferase II
MKILIELPTWLGDTVMVTPAIENLINHFQEVELTLIGSYVALELMKNHPKVVDLKLLNRDYVSQFNVARGIGKFNYYFSFRGSFRSQIFKFFINSEMKYQFRRNKYPNSHQVEKYNNFINDSLKINSNPGELNVYLNTNSSKVEVSKALLLGINPGASYGQAKRWYPDKFAEVIVELSSKYDIVILGGVNELEIANDIEKILIKNEVENYKNLVGKTTITELKSIISSLDLLITGDSGPMHLAASFQVPTVSIFGPTKVNETSQWKNDKSFVVKKNLSCQPCMKRKCPLKHHNCMSKIKVKDVIDAAISIT